MEIHIRDKTSGRRIPEPAETGLPFTQKSWQHFRAGSANGYMEYSIRSSNEVEIQVFHSLSKNNDQISLDLISGLHYYPFTMIFQLFGSSVLIPQRNQSHPFFERSANLFLHSGRSLNFRFPGNAPSLLVLIHFSEMIAISLDEEASLNNSCQHRFLSRRNFTGCRHLLDLLSEILFSDGYEEWVDFLLEEEVRYIIQELINKKDRGPFHPSHAEKSDADWFQQMNRQLLAVKNKSISFQQLLKTAGITEIKRFRRLLHSFYGLSIQQQLTEARIAEAQTLLRTTCLPIKQISALTGYQNIYYFTKIFKQYTGVPPSRFQKMIDG